LKAGLGQVGVSLLHSCKNLGSTSGKIANTGMLKDFESFFVNYIP